MTFALHRFSKESELAQTRASTKCEMGNDYEEILIAIPVSDRERTASRNHAG